MNLQNFGAQWMTPFGSEWFFGVGGLVLLILVVWSIVWKGMALWRAAKLDSKVWFVVLLVVNTIGILEILYLYVFSKKKAVNAANVQ